MCMNLHTAKQPSTRLPFTQFADHRQIEFRIVLLHVSRAVLLMELLDHGFHRFGFRDRLRSELCFRAPRINPNRRVLEHVFVPLRVGALNGQEVELFAFQHEPDWDRDCLPRLPADYADLDLAVGCVVSVHAVAYAEQCLNMGING
jgi:hypothetical protein